MQGKISIFKILLDWVFKIRPVDIRPDIRRLFIKKITCPLFFVSDKDDTYIYAQIIIFSTILFAAINFLLLYLYSNYLSLDFLFLSIDFSIIPSFDHWARQFALIAQKIFYFFILPFFLFKLYWNIDFVKYDIFWWNRAKRKGQEFGKLDFLVLAIAWVVFHGSYGLPLYLAESLHLKSAFVFLCFMLFVSWILAGASWMFIYFTMIIVRHIFKR